MKTHRGNCICGAVRLEAETDGLLACLIRASAVTVWSMPEAQRKLVGLETDE